jgi:pimeloyl-ACP methyl ester carboxylesterase
MKPTILYLPGLDGEGYCARKLEPHVATANVEVFTYPTGKALDWVSLCDSVVSTAELYSARLLAGESFGGAVAQQTILRHPGAFDSVMLISTFTSPPEPFAAMLGRNAARLLPEMLLKPAARALAGWKLAGTLDGDNRKEFLRRFSDLDIKEMGRRLELLRSHDTANDLANVSLPIEVIYGDKDSIAANEPQREVWHRLNNATVHVIEGFGHLVAAEAAEQTAAIITNWATRHAE